MFGPALALLVAAGLSGAPARTPAIRAFPVPSRAAVSSIVAGPDGELWFVAGGRRAIGRIAPGGHVSLYGVPGARIIEPELAVAADGTLVFACDDGFGRMTTSGQVTRFTTPVPNLPDDFSLAAGPDGSVWVTYGAVVRLDPDGGFSYVPQYGDAVAIAPGPDGAMWYLESDDEGAHPGVVRIAPDGSERRFPAPGFDLRGGRIAAGPDGAMWFVGASRILSARNLIGRLAPSGRLRVFRVRGRGAGIDDVAPGPDGAMWFTDERGYIGRISARGRIAEFRVPRRVRQPYRITAGPDGAMWFTAGDIGRIAG